MNLIISRNLYNWDIKTRKYSIYFLIQYDCIEHNFKQDNHGAEFVAFEESQIDSQRHIYISILHE